MMWAACAWVLQCVANGLLWLEEHLLRAERWLRRRARRTAR